MEKTLFPIFEVSGNDPMTRLCRNMQLNEVAQPCRSFFPKDGMVVEK